MTRRYITADLRSSLIVATAQMRRLQNMDNLRGHDDHDDTIRALMDAEEAIPKRARYMDLACRVATARLALEYERRCRSVALAALLAATAEAGIIPGWRRKLANAFGMPESLLFAPRSRDHATLTESPSPTERTDDDVS